MRFLDKVFGDTNDGKTHGVLAGFLPAIAPSLVAAGAVALGAPLGAVALATVGAVAVAANRGAAGGPVCAGVFTTAAGGVFAAGYPFFAAAGLFAVASVPAIGGAEEKKDYDFRSYLAGTAIGCLVSAALAFGVVEAPLPPEQPKAPVAELTPSTLESGGRCGEDFKSAVLTDDPLGQKIYTIAARVNCLSSGPHTP